MRNRSACALVAALALGAPAAAHAKGPASVHLKGCTTGAEPSARSATYKAWVDAVPGAVRMSLRFKLIAHYPGHQPQQVTNPELSVWHKSHKGVTRYGYKQTVKQLGPGASYRALVNYRWHDSDGHVIRRATRVSEPCAQTGELPNLTISAVRISPGATPGNSVYSVSFANSGKGEAHNFNVALIVDGAVADARPIARLGPGESTTIDLNGPACDRLRAVVDREHAVAEMNEADNSLASRC